MDTRGIEDGIEERVEGGVEGEVKGDSAKVQIGAELRCKGGKVSAAGGREITEYRVRITEKTTEGDGWLEYGWLGGR